MYYNARVRARTFVRWQKFMSSGGQTTWELLTSAVNYIGFLAFIATSVHFGQIYCQRKHGKDVKKQAGRDSEDGLIEEGKRRKKGECKQVSVTNRQYMVFPNCVEY